LKTRWFFAFFFVSGFCSLVYEVVWLRLGIAKFGVTTAMVSIVLSVFMAGLGLGSWAGGALIRRFDRLKAANALRLYGFIELLIGLFGLAAPLILNLGYDVVRDAGRGLAWGSSVYYLASGLWVSIALLPGCTCMGATFPFAMAAIRGLAGGESKRSFSYLYLANVLGAVLGTLVPAFVLIELFGFRGTLRIASALNGLLGTGVLLLSGFLVSMPRGTLAATPAVGGKSTATSVMSPFFLLFTTGICSMAMEVVWIRQFTVYLGNVVYAFATILALYLMATFAGSSIYRRRALANVGQSGRTLWIFAGIISLLPLVFADPRFPAPEFNTGLGSFLFGALRAGLAIAPFSALAGFLTPMLVDKASAGDPDRAGKAYAVNVFGSITGPLVAGFGILPWAGERWALFVIAIPLFAIGAAYASRSARESGSGSSSRWAYAVTVAASLAIAALSRNYDAIFPQRRELRDHTATVIATGEGMHRRLLVNGIGMTRLTPITKIMAHLPLAILDRPGAKGLVICFGMGTTFRSMLSWGIRTTAVDLVPSVPKMFDYYHPDGDRLAASPLAQVVIDDGRRLLERSSERFDVIATDPPPPIGAPGSSLLYSEEFYSVVRRHLSPGGILQIWFPGGDHTTLAAITKALRDSFPYVRAYQSIEGWGIHFLASAAPLQIKSGQELAQRLPARAAEDLVEWNPESTPAQMFADVLGREQSLDSFVAAEPSVSPITDDRPINEYYLLRSVNAPEEEAE
jgi:spermidine synthase